MSYLKILFVSFAIIFSFSTIEAQPKTGEKVPEVLLPDPNGQKVSLDALRGKVVLIDFWASWCGPCRYSNKRILPIYEKYKTAGFEIFAISLDDNLHAWKKAIQVDNITWLQVNEAGGWDAPIARKWRIDQIPTSFLIDKEGRVVAIDPSEDKLVSLINKLLKQPYKPAGKP